MSTQIDPISDMLSRIRNAISVNKTEVSMPHSKAKESIAMLLKENRYISEVSAKDATIGKVLHITINKEDENSSITEITRMSKPGRRYFSSAEKIPVIKRGRGIVIVSTSRGLMTDKEARKQGIGGELICKVY